MPTRERILDTARSMFASAGYHGTSIRDIAGALHVSVSAVYNHFLSKEAILVEVLRRPILLNLEVVERHLADTEGHDPLERLGVCLRAHYSFLIGNRLDAELINSEYLRLADVARASIVQLRNRYEELFRALLVACLPASRRDSIPPSLAVVLNILLGLAGNNHRWFRDGGPLSRDQVLDVYVRFAMGGVAAWLQGDTA